MASLFGLPNLAQAQPAKGSSRFPIPKVSQYVPIDTGLFVYSDRILATELEAHDDGIIQLMLKLSGGNPVGWKAILTQALGVESNAALKEILKERLAIAAPDWHHLEDGVIIIDEYNPRLLSLVTGRGRVKKQEQTNNVKIVQSSSGLWVAATRRMLILSQRSDANSIFRRSIKLLAGSNDAPLSSNPKFKSCLAGLPPGCKACVYWHDSASSHESQSPGREITTHLWEMSPSNVIGLQGRQNLLEVTHVGQINSNGIAGYRPRVKFERVRQLPQTTLASWSTSINWQSMFSDPDLNPTIAELLKIFGLLSKEGDAGLHEDIVANLGPRCTVIIGADFADKDLHPRVAIMIESVDSQAIVSIINQNVQNSAGSDPPTDAPVDDEDDVPIKIHTIKMPEKTGNPNGDTIGALIAENLAPSYAAIDGWFVVSTSADHVKEIIEASQGKSPRLEDVLPIHAHTQRVSRAVDLVLVQPSFLHGILQFWQSQLSARSLSENDDSRLGIEIQSETTPGQAVVVHVDSNGVAADHLHPGDRILACNTILLDYDNPNQHLKDLLAPKIPAIGLRVLRGKQIVDVSIAPQPRVQPTSRIQKLLSGVEPFQALFLNSTIALFIKERPINGIAVTRLAIELDRIETKSKARKSDTPEPNSSGSR
ncbi:MAG: hypothetical protein DHS20C16_11840 [Phycisphaerae bacterium]|nr:MAG: hypothetical protein DHS20C16_11840 [Phycisphaerae bacterium]